MEAPEAPLNAEQPEERPSVDVLWVSPRHLAGDDGELAERVGDELVGAGWSYWVTARRTLFYASPDQLRCAEWVMADPLTTELADLPVAWEISAREDSSRATVNWTAYFTRGVPYEAVATFALAVADRTEPAWGFDGPEAVPEMLVPGGWQGDVDDPNFTLWDDSFTACMTRAPLPGGIHDQDPRPDMPGWQAWSQPEVAGPYLWVAAFSTSTPHELVAAFAAGLVGEAPVPRRVLPASSRARLTIRPSL
ncbi:DUF317 domain-containing protein [Streptomyces sp. NBC_00096]|uniref:DUF317 domain-containing protein n=1 Tax=Streptomyces sp. NBC_00096 TaxID=2975650 RepID=UPI0032524075